jgi:hypothetical protein
MAVFYHYYPFLPLIAVELGIFHKALNKVQQSSARRMLTMGLTHPKQVYNDRELMRRNFEERS